MWPCTHQCFQVSYVPVWKVLNALSLKDWHRLSSIRKLDCSILPSTTAWLCFGICCLPILLSTTSHSVGDSLQGECLDVLSPWLCKWWLFCALDCNWGENIRALKNRRVLQLVHACKGVDQLTVVNESYYLMLKLILTWCSSTEDIGLCQVHTR